MPRVKGNAPGALHQDREMRLALRMEEMPYPADTIAKNPARNIMPGEVVAAPRHILNATAPAMRRKMKPRNSMPERM